MSSGGGGGQSSSTYPPYMKSMHSYMLSGLDEGGFETLYGTMVSNNSLIGALNRALNGEVDPSSPWYDDVSGTTTPIDPFTDYLDNITPHMTNLENAVNDLDDTEVLEDLVDVFEQNIEQTHLSSLSTITSGYSDINAVNSSAFMVSVSLLEQNRLNRVAQYRTQLMLQNRTVKLQGLQAVLGSSMGIERMRVVAAIDQKEQGFEYKARNLEWDISLYRGPGNFLGSLAGSVESRSATKTNSNTLGAIGSLIGGAGGLIGGVASGLESLFGGGGESPGTAGSGTVAPSMT